MLFLGLASGLLGGLAWSLWRPAYLVDTNGAHPEIAVETFDPGAQFVTLGQLAVITAGIGVLLGVTAWRQARKGAVKGGPGYLLWLIVVAALATAAALALGAAVPHGGRGGAGTWVPYAVDTRPVWFVAPFVASGVFWVSTFIALAATGRQKPQPYGHSPDPLPPGTPAAPTPQGHPAGSASTHQ